MVSACFDCCTLQRQCCCLGPVEFQVVEVFLFFYFFKKILFPMWWFIFTFTFTFNKKFSVSLGENMFDIVCKSKRPFHFLERTITTTGDDSVPIVDLTQNLPPKKIRRKSGNLIRCFKMFGLINFFG